MKKLFYVSLGLLSILKANAQNQIKESSDTVSMKLLHSRVQGNDLVDYLHSTTSKHFHDPNAPRFLLYDQQRKIAFGIGGYVRVTTSYDFNGSPSNSSTLF